MRPVLGRAIARLPPGTLPVSVGLLVLGLTTYLALAVAARGVGPVTYGPVSVLWAAIFTLGSGVFSALEQLTARELAHGRDALGVVRSAARCAWQLVAAVLVLIAVTAPWLRESAFATEPALVWALALGVVALAGEHLVRGCLSGRGDLVLYGGVLGGTGVARALACLALLALGSGSATAYGLALAGAPLVVVVPMLVRELRRSRNADRAPGFAGPLGLLVAGTGTALLVVNMPSLAVTALAHRNEAELAGRLGASLVVARLPLFAFFAVSSVLVPQLTAARVESPAVFTGRLRQALVAAIALGAAGTVALGLLGPPLTTLLFGTDFDVGRATLGILTAAAGLFMVATVLAAALVALGLAGRSLLGWSAGAAATLVVMVVAEGLDSKITLGFLAGTATACVALGLCLAAALVRPADRALLN